MDHFKLALPSFTKRFVALEDRIQVDVMTDAINPCDMIREFWNQVAFA